MKVILLQDVAKLGRRFDVVEAPNGYAMNKLVPQRLAEPATPQNLKKIEARKEKQEAERTQVDTDFKAALEILTNSVLTVSASANEQGHLFKAVHEADIVAAAATVDAKITEAQIHIGKPIKTTGEHIIELHAGAERKEVTINVSAA